MQKTNLENNKKDRLSLRWWLKKSGRAAFSLSARNLEKGLVSGAETVNRARILTYHRFSEDRQDPFSVSAQAFNEQMSVLAREKRAISLSQLQAFLRGEARLPAQSCLVTIDDGMMSTLSEALPILEKWQIPAVAFVSSKLVGLDEPTLPEPYLDKEQLRELNSSTLITIGSHAHTHRSMGELDMCDMREEAVRSREILSEVIEDDVISFAYPFGMQKDHNKQTDEVLLASGYQIAFNSMHGPVMPGMDPISLPRIKIEGGESVNMFRRISLGALDRWRIVDDHLWRLQRVRQEIS